MKELKVAYECPFEFIVDVHVRLGELCGGYRRSFRMTLVLISLMGVGGWFLLDVDRAAKTVGLVVYLIVTALLSWFWFPSHYRSEVRKYLVTALGSDKNISIEYVLDEHGITCLQIGVTSSFPWSVITECIDADRFIELIIQPMGIVRIAKHALSDSECRIWLDTIRGQIKSA